MLEIALIIITFVKKKSELIRNVAMTKHFSYNTQNGKPCVELGGWLLCKQIQTPSHREHQTGWDHPPPGGGRGKQALLEFWKHPPALPAARSQPAGGVCCLNRSTCRRNGGSGCPPSTAFYPTPPFLTKAPKVITMKMWVSMTPTLTSFSKNENNKHKSLLSKQELSAFNAKKKKKKNHQKN